jgi:hypothetical protein
MSNDNIYVIISHTEDDLWGAIPLEDYTSGDRTPPERWVNLRLAEPSLLQRHFHLVEVTQEGRRRMAVVIEWIPQPEKVYTRVREASSPKGRKKTTTVAKPKPPAGDDLVDPDDIPF